MVGFLAAYGWLGLVCHHARGEGGRGNVDCEERREESGVLWCVFYWSYRCGWGWEDKAMGWIELGLG